MLKVDIIMVAQENGVQHQTDGPLPTASAPDGDM